ncbi:hypothetical protein A6764_01240 [Brevibacillus sp. WF146]|uniref:hypothetical protein n=1 Tax=Brevibacillus sp. WF146 TaxID=319501 RepID=UPI0007EE2777|nr:hypothetical protein [Brevibacillus sp. WF146]UYZ13647.1 hypothetical protein A6764_01240 [Brevibacillus sp. WF146]
MKKIYLLTLSAFIMIFFSACNHMNSENSNFVPEITLKVGNDNISSTIKSRTLDTVDFEDTSLFQSIMNDPEIKIPYVKLGETVYISFNKEPKSYELRESILNTDGVFKYKSQPAQQQPVNIKFNNKSATFNLNENIYARLSSNSSDYKPGGTIRGFRLVCKWEDRTQEFVFVIKTDAYKPSTTK